MEILDDAFWFIQERKRMDLYKKKILAQHQ